jgi:hypothetical protein
VSVCVHAFPSLHAVPSTATGFAHAPVTGLHVPGPWHWSAAAHVTGVVPTQAPAWQTSRCVHALPSLHAVPSATGIGLVHAPVVGSHVPAEWH